MNAHANKTKVESLILVKMKINSSMCDRFKVSVTGAHEQFMEKSARASATLIGGEFVQCTQFISLLDMEQNLQCAIQHPGRNEKGLRCSRASTVNIISAGPVLK